MFDELKVFIAVAETRSFTKAAMLLNFSQPAISQQIKKLEIFFKNTPLIARCYNTKQIELTEEGKIVYRHGKAIMALFGTIFDDLESLSVQMPHSLRVGASMTIGNHLLPTIIYQLKKEDPDINPKLWIGNSKGVCQQLKEGEIDIGLIEGKSISYDFKRTDFFTDPLILVASPEIAADYGKFSPGNLSKAAWIVRESGSGTEQYFQAFLESNHILLEHKIECNSNEASCEMVKAGLGIAFLSQLAVNRELRAGTLVRLPMNRNYVRKFSFILPDGRGSNPLTVQLTEILKKSADWYCWE